jgi:outer membrane lipoprotein SlyB
MANQENSMKTRPIAIALMLAGLMSVAQAQTSDAKRIAARYTADKQLCAEENNSSTRMQCLRDAKSEHDKALAQAKAPHKPASACHDCGRVTSVSVRDKDGEGGAVGLIAGGVAGALLGNQVGSGHGRQLATVAGAAGGAYAGKKIEGKAKSTKEWTVHVKYDNGQQASFNYDHDPKMHNGDRVRKSNGTLVRN